MNLCMPVSRYLRLLRNRANEALSLSIILSPFLIHFKAKESDYLLVGHFLEEFIEIFDNNRKNIDPMDVAALAFNLGYDEAKIFLEEGPMFIDQCVKGSLKTSFPLGFLGYARI